MNDILWEQTPLHITPLSPVHIGADDDYAPTNYVMLEQALFAFDSHALSQLFSTKQRHDLLEIVSKPARRPEDMLKQIQAFFYNQREALAAIAHHSLPVSQGVYTLYQERIGQTANRESGGKSVINQLAIERSLFNPYTQQPFLAGSSLKGAIRTALLDQLNNHAPLQSVIDPHTHKPRKETHQALQERLFQGKFATDPMRLITLSDARYQLDDLYASDIRFAVNRRKKAVLQDGELVPSRAEAGQLYQLLECLAPLRYRSFKSDLTLQKLPLQEMEGTPVKALRWNLATIAAACNNFYYPRFKTELALLQAQHYVSPSWAKTLEQVFSGSVFKQMQAGKAFLVRVGRHSGAEAMTLNAIRQIKIQQGKNKPANIETEAKTIWLAAHEHTAHRDLLPFGWLLVELDDQPNTDLPALCQPWLAHAQQQQNQLLTLKQKYLAALQTANAPELWQGARIKYNRANGALTLEKKGKTVTALAPQSEALLNTLTPALKQKILGNQFIKVNASVREKTILSIEAG